MAPRPKPVDHDAVDRLAERGLTNRQIADEMGISTVHLWRSGWRRRPPPLAHEIDWDRAQRMLDDGAFMPEVAAAFGISVKTLRRRRASLGLPPLKVAPRFLERSPRWNGGRQRLRRGYVMLKRPDHPDAKAGGYIFEHRLVMEQQIGRRLRPEEVVHHINGVKDDNRPENLQLFASNGEHIAATRKGISRKK